jgi:hypothetical protein
MVHCFDMLIRFDRCLGIGGHKLQKGHFPLALDNGQKTP